MSGKVYVRMIKKKKKIDNTPTISNIKDLDQTKNLEDNLTDSLNNNEETYQDILNGLDKDSELGDSSIVSGNPEDLDIYFGSGNLDEDIIDESLVDNYIEDDMLVSAPVDDIPSDMYSNITLDSQTYDELENILADLSDDNDPESDIDSTIKDSKLQNKKVKKTKKSKTKKNKGTKGDKTKSKGTKDKNSKVSVLSSINTKMSLSVCGGVLLSLIVTFIVTMSGFSSSIDELVESNMSTVVKAYNTLLEDTILLTKNNLTTSNLTSLYKEEGLDGVESSYVCLIDADGKYTYHREYQKIGTQVDSQVILDLVEEHKKNPLMESGVTEYQLDEIDKYAGYYPCDNGWLLIVSANKDELYQTYYDVRKATLIDSGVILVVLAVLGFLVSLTVTKPIKKLTGVIHKIAELDFRSDEGLEKLCKRKDETGDMSRALRNMQGEIKNVISNINTASENISDNAHSLNELSNLVNEHSTDNSATTEELATGMQETATTAERIDSNINNILSTIDNISNKTKDGQNIAFEIMEKASKLKVNTQDASLNGQKMFADVRKETYAAIEKSKDVDKINSLTKTILDISDQTSLLSLNASIEAARAGEAGRGFAVVAEQIGHLANQSATTVENIGGIVKEVNDAVNNMAKCLETTLNFLEEKVLKDYDSFISVSEEYNSDADVFEKLMKDIYDSIVELDRSTELIADAISGISTTIVQSSTGVSDIAEKTSNIVELTIQTNQMVDESVEYAKNLNDIVDIFKLK